MRPEKISKLKASLYREMVDNISDEEERLSWVLERGVKVCCFYKIEVSYFWCLYYSLVQK